MEDNYCVDAEDYQEAYRDFFDKFLKCVNPEDQLPVKVSAYDVTESEIIGEVIYVTLQYIRQTNCPLSLQGYLVHLVIEEITLLCKNNPEYCGLRQVSKLYAPLKLMQAVTSKVYEICKAYCALNSKVKSLPPPPSTPYPLVAAGGIKNMRRKMEDRHVVLHDLHSIFNIQPDSVANYYAVFDGHGGQDAAVYCATHLHQYLVESTHYPTDPERALHDAFLATDARFIEKSETQRIFGGSTAICALILKKKLYVAWAGDSMAVLVKQNGIHKLVKPHRPNRETEMQRIEKMGGMVVWQSGIFRVNGMLNVSRAIGDVRHKPYISSEPEIRVETLDGTEDFLVIGCDGLWDFVDTHDTMALIYRMVRQDPHDLKQISRFLLQWAKHCGSQDNITVIVVFLTPPTEIAARPGPTPLHSMDSFCSKVLKDQLMGDIGIDDRQQSQEHRQQRDQNENGDGDAIDDNRLVIERTSNGKHENGSTDYDYEDLGPETDVDAIDDVPETCCTPLDKLSRELFPDEKSQQKSAQGDDDQDAAGEKANDFEQKEAFAHNDDFSPPPSPTTKSNQHALIAESDNVADSEDSEDEWNYYRVDPNKEKESTTPVNEVNDTKDLKQSSESLDIKQSSESLDIKQSSESLDIKQSSESLDLKQSSESLDEDNLDSQSPEAENESKCKSPTQEVSSELIDTDISAQGTLTEPEEKQDDSTLVDHTKDERDMDFQLNPDAAEFVPVSPSAIDSSRMNHLMQGVIAGSPLKNTFGMDHIPVPSQREFEEEISQRPSELDSEERPNGDHPERDSDLTDFIGDRQKAAGVPISLDESEISSTKAEFGDESATSFLTATDFPRTGASMVIDDSFADSERDFHYDISNDPMAVSISPGDFEMVLAKDTVDLNAVHDLTGDDLGEENGTAEEDTAMLDKSDSDFIHSDVHADARSFEPEVDAHPEPQTQSQNPFACDLTAPKRQHPGESNLLLGTDLMDELQSSSADQKDIDLTFVETEQTNNSKPSDFLMDFQSRRQSSPIEGKSLMDQDDHQEDLQSVESPLSTNASEFFPNKELHAVEQHLSPFEADADVSKHVTEGSEETTALLDGQSLQQSSSKDQDTPSSLSPLPDLDCSPESAQITAAVTSSTPPAVSSVPTKTDFLSSELNPDTLEFDKKCPFSSSVPKEEPVSFSAPEVPVLQNPLDLNAGPISTTQSAFEDLSSRKEPLPNFATDPEPFTKSPIENVAFELPNLQQPQGNLMKDMDELVCPFGSTKKFEDLNSQQEDAFEMKTEEICNVETSRTIKPDEHLNLAEEDTHEFAGLDEQMQAKPAEPVEATTPVETKSQLTEDLKEIPSDTPVTMTEESKPREEEIESAYLSQVHEENVTPADTFELQEEKQDRVELAAEAKELQTEKPVEPAEPIETKLVVEAQEVVPTAAIPEVPVAEPAAPLDEPKEQIQETSSVPEVTEVAPAQVSAREGEALASKVEEVPTEALASQPMIEAVPVTLPVTEAPPVEASSTTEAIPEVTQASDTKATAIAATAVAAAATAAVATTTAKSTKPATKATAKPSKPSSATTKAPKSTPTSPSKTVSSSTRTTTTATAAKKPSTTSATARPKPSDLSAKTSVTSTTKTVSSTRMSAAAKTTSTAPKPAAARPSSGVAPKPKVPSTLTKTSDKKPTTNGDVKPLSKLSAKPPASKPVGSTTATTAKSSTLVKSSTTTRTSTIGAAKTRPISAATQAATKAATKPTTGSTTTARPRTAPSTGTAPMRPKVSATKSSPVIDKQIKETANKQISLSRTSTSTVSKTSRSSVSGTTTGTTLAKRTSTTKTSTTTTTLSPKKPAPISKLTGKAPTKSPSAAAKSKVVQNGVSNNIEITNTIITTSGKIDDDVPTKDLSPVMAPTDNQLIVTAD